MNAARLAAPGMTPSLVAYPGTPFSSRAHYTVFMRGETALTSRLLKPVLIDASTVQLPSAQICRGMSLRVVAVAAALFGDYGGLPLKILWALFDVVTMIVIGDGTLSLGRSVSSEPESQKADN